MNTINRVTVMNALHNLMGHRVSPGGTDDDYKRYIQDSFEYCWRYYKWRWTMKQVTTAIDGLLPVDFDPLGLNDLPDGVDFGWDSTNEKFVVEPAQEITVNYQQAPPELDDSTNVPFPSAMVVAIGATVLAKQGANPTRADIQQEWDMWHSRLDRLVGQAESNIRRTPQNRQSIMGTFTGDV